MNCCLCGNTEPEVAWCWICNHYFCGECRYRLWPRLVAGVKQHLLKNPPRFCSHQENTEQRTHVDPDV